MNRKQPLEFGCVALIYWLTASCSLSASAQTRYSITGMGTINTLNGGVMAINNRGEAVGGDGHGFLWADGKRFDLDTLPPTEPEDDTTEMAYGINNRDQIVGSSGSFRPVFMSGLQFARGVFIEGRKAHQFTGHNVSFIPYAINDAGEIVGLDAYRGFYYAHGRLTELKTLSTLPNGNRSTARSINRAGQVVGWSTVDSTQRGKYDQLPTHAFLWQKGVNKDRMRDLGTLPGWPNSYAYAINCKSEITGTVTDASGTPFGFEEDSEAGSPAQAFLWRRGKMAALERLPGGRYTEAFGINDSAVIAGSCDGRAVIWHLDRITDLNTYLPPESGWILEKAQAINNKGQITGTGALHGEKHLFLLTPFPLR